MDAALFPQLPVQVVCALLVFCSGCRHGSMLLGLSPREHASAAPVCHEFSTEVAGLRFHKLSFLSSCVLFVPASPFPCLWCGLDPLSCGQRPTPEGLHWMAPVMPGPSCPRPTVQPFLCSVGGVCCRPPRHLFPVVCLPPSLPLPRLLGCLMSCFLSSLSSM